MIGCEAEGFIIGMRDCKSRTASLTQHVTHSRSCTACSHRIVLHYREQSDSRVSGGRPSYRGSVGLPISLYWLWPLLDAIYFDDGEGVVGAVLERVVDPVYLLEVLDAEEQEKRMSAGGGYCTG